MIEEKEWSELGKLSDADLNDLLSLPAISKLQSNNPLIKIKRSLKLNIIWGIALICPFIVLIIMFSYWQIRIAILAIIAFYVWTIYVTWLQYCSLPESITTTDPVLAELKKHRDSIIEWFKAICKIGMFIYPVSIAGGAMLGAVIGSGKSIGFLFTKPLFVVVFLILIVAFTPLSNYLAKWFFKKGFGKHLDLLEENIKALELEV
jgi:hypothetical protein